MNNACRLKSANGNHAGRYFTNRRGSHQEKHIPKNPKIPTRSLADLRIGNMSHSIAPGPPALTVLRVAASAIAMKGSSQSRTLYPYAIFKIRPAAGMLVVVDPYTLAQSSSPRNRLNHLLNLRVGKASNQLSLLIAPWRAVEIRTFSDAYQSHGGYSRYPREWYKLPCVVGLRSS